MRRIHGLPWFLTAVLSAGGGAPPTLYVKQARPYPKPGGQ